MQTWLAPAKLNLFLHIVGQREDGYHLLQSVIQLIDLCDELTFSLRNDVSIHCENSDTVISPEDDLCVKAAQLLQSTAGVKQGADINIKKKIPLGAGMGGGSSDAATTLLALNEMWDCNLSLSELELIGLKLGADVPVFIHGKSCWMEGVGEQLIPVTLDEIWFVVIYPNVHLNTQQMFADPDLTRNCALLKIRDFSQLDVEHLCDMGNTQNVFEPIARRYPKIEEAFQWLNQHAPARLTGSGSALFACCESKQVAENIAAKCAEKFTTYAVKGLNQSPVISVSEYNYS